LLDDSSADPNVQLGALKALQAMGPLGSPAAARVGRMIKSSNAELQVQAVETLGEMKAGSYASQLVDLIGYKNLDLTYAVESALSSFGAIPDEVQAKITKAYEQAAKSGVHPFPPPPPFPPPEAFNDFPGAEEQWDKSASAMSDEQLIAPMIKGDGQYIWKWYFDRLISIKRKISVNNTFTLIDAGYKDTTHLGDYTVLAYVTSATADMRDLVLRLSSSPNGYSYAHTDPCKDRGNTEISLLAKAFIETKGFPNLRRSIADSMVACANLMSALTVDPKALLAVAGRLRDADYAPQALALEKTVEVQRTVNEIMPLGKLIIAQVFLWVLFIFWYPRSPWVQTVFFWNKWVRRSLGFAYVGWLLTYVPFLRRRLLAPFAPSLLPDRVLAAFNPKTYYESMEVVEDAPTRERKVVRAADALASFKGQVVLKAPSGAGKTMILLKLATTLTRPAVLLAATECTQGVLGAIQLRLQGQARDEWFLRSIIYAGGLDILIDGVNECSPIARAQIISFVTEHFRGNVLMTTQPIDWESPRTARIFELQELKSQQIEDFLISQWPEVRLEHRVTEEEYRRRVSEYLRCASIGEAPASELSPLRNPMEAVIAADLLAQGVTPDPLRLIQQQFQRMSNRFLEEKGRGFQKARFAERVYAWRISGNPDIDVSSFEADVAYLAKSRLMLQRTESETQASGIKEITRWVFRHEKIMFYFMLPALVGPARQNRREQHIPDERFLGIYELLAVELSDSDEEMLYIAINAYAADSNENELRNRYERARRRRRNAKNPTIRETEAGQA